MSSQLIAPTQTPVTSRPNEYNGLAYQRLNNSASHKVLHNRHKGPTKHQDSRKPKLLLRRTTTMYLLILYLPLLVVPWVFICILNERPIGITSYYNQNPGLSRNQFRNIRASISAAQVMNAVAAVLVIPVLSAIVAEAAVVYCQRRHEDQTLTIRQTFALADRAWSDIPRLCKAVFSKKEKDINSRFLWLSSLLLLLGEFPVTLSDERLCVFSPSKALFTSLYSSCLSRMPSKRL